MAWAVPRYSKTQVDRAGSDLVSEDMGSMLQSLEIIGNWRSAHNYPLNIFQDSLRKRARIIDPECIIAQRIKRLSSITAKLERFPSMRLSMMQDIGGCRAVMRGVSEVEILAKKFLSSRIRHKLSNCDDYIKSPKSSGYRGVHLVYRYISERKTTYNGL